MYVQFIFASELMSLYLIVSIQLVFFFKESILQISVFLFKLSPCTVNAITNKVAFAVACFLLVFHTSYVVHSVLDVIPLSPCFLLC